MVFCTIERLAEQALRIINGGDINYEEDLDERDLQMYIIQAIGALVKRGFLQSKGTEVGEVDGNLILTFDDIVVKQDAKGFFATLPSCTVGLMEGRGIHEVGDENGAFIPTMNGFTSLYEGLDAVKLEGRIGYFPENGTVRFFNESNFKDHTVFMKLTAAYDAIEPDAEISIPLDMQQEIVGLAVQLFGQLPNTDEVPDNVDE